MHPDPGEEERKKHHYIPVFYLQQWVRREDGKLCEFSRPYKTPPGQPEPSIKSIPVKPSGCTPTLRVFSGIRREVAGARLKPGREPAMRITGIGLIAAAMLAGSTGSVWPKRLTSSLVVEKSGVSACRAEWPTRWSVRT